MHLLLAVRSLVRTLLDVSARVLSSFPTPIADALVALLAADSAFEQRDRVVEVFRAELRLLAALVLAARVQFGPGPLGEASAVPDLLRGLRARGLTDGQWVALVRELLRPWASSPEAHPLPALVKLLHGRKSKLIKLWDELLVMRKSETVAHGASGTREALVAILLKRTPQLARTLELLDPVFADLRIVAAREGNDAETASLFVGPTPASGRARTIELPLGLAVSASEVVLVDRDGHPKVALFPPTGRCLRWAITSRSESSSWARCNFCSSARRKVTQSSDWNFHPTRVASRPPRAPAATMACGYWTSLLARWSSSIPKMQPGRSRFLRMAGGFWQPTSPAG